MLACNRVLSLIAAVALFSLSSRAAAQSQSLTDAHGDPLPKGALGRLGTVRLRHGAAIEDLAFLPDGKTVASRGGDRENAVRLWDLATGQERQHFRLVLAANSAAAFSLDRTVVAAADKESSCVYDLATGKLLHRHGQVSEAVWSGPVCLSGDNRITAECFFTDVVLRDVDTGKVRHTLDAHDPDEFTLQTVNDLIPSPDGRLLATVRNKPNLGFSIPSEVIVWDIATGRRLYRFAGRFARPVFAPDGKTLIAVAEDGKTIIVRESATGRKVWSFTYQETADRSRRWSRLASFLALGPGGKLLAVACDDKILVVDVDSRRQVSTLSTPQGYIDRVAFSQDGRRVVSALTTEGDDRKVILQVWQVPVGKELQRITLPMWYGLPQRRFALSSDGETLAVAVGNTIRLWDVPSGKEKHARAGHHQSVTDIALAPDCREAVTTGEDNIICFWDLATHRPRAQRRAMPNSYPGLAFAADGKTLLSLTGNGLALWDVATAHLNRRINDTRKVCALASDGRTIAYEAKDGKVHLFDALADDKGIGIGTARVESYQWGELHGTFASDKRRFAAIDHASDHRKVWQWDLTLNRPLPQLSGLERHLHVAAYAPDARTLAGLNRSNPYWPDPTDGEVRLWEVVTGYECMRIREPKITWWSLAFAPDYRRLAVGSTDGSIYVWDTATGKRLGSFNGHRGPVASLCFAPNGKMLFSASADTTVLIWDLTPVAPPNDLRAATEACWADLADRDATKAYRAVWALAGAPKQSLPFLATHLKPIPSPDRKQVRRWIADLDSDRYETRSGATQILASLGLLVEPAIVEAIQSTPPLELRRRLENLLVTIRGIPLAEELRLLRAIQVLELIGSPEAQAVLKTLSKGAAGARQTHEARGSLDRLEKRAIGTE